MTVVKIAEEEVFDKIDTQYVAAQFPGTDHVGITFLCTLDEEEEDEWVDDKGRLQVVVRLPYELVRRSVDIRALLVAKVKERLARLS